MKDRISRKPGRYTATVPGEDIPDLQAGKPFSITLTRDDDPEVIGTPYSKAAVLPDSLAEEICPDVEDPTPADAFNGIIQKIKTDCAPSGYGLGEEAGPTVVVDPTGVSHIFKHIDTVTENGIYYLYDALGDIVPSHGTLIVTGNRFYKTQTVISNQGGYIIRRHYTAPYSGAYGEWEYDNPPMELGIEYRTTERWDGKAVYTKAISCGNLPAVGTQRATAHNASATQMLRVCGHFDGRDALPFYDKNIGDIRISASLNSVKINVINWEHTTDVTSLTASAQIWYLKD